MLVSVRNNCTDFSSYRSARVKSLFNVESGANFSIDADLPIEDDGWSIGVVVGPSGSGKTSIGRRVFGDGAIHAPTWRGGVPIVDEIAPEGKFDDVTAALAAVGLGNVPSWLRPYEVLSNGEKFRADLARLVCEKPERVVVDEFTSVVDRQIAKFGALAFQKSWRRTGGKAVLLTCHYDVLEWIEPDWIFDTQTRLFQRRSLRRPKFDVEVFATDWSYWPLFEPHHYLKIPKMVGAQCYVGAVDGEPVCHLAVGTMALGRDRFEARACRLVVMPEWQGAGVGLRFLDHVCQLQLDGLGRTGRRITTMFHTSHPGLAAALRRNRKWVQVSERLFANNGSTNKKAAVASGILRGRKVVMGAKQAAAGGSWFGGHLRAVQGFRYMGDRGGER
jgi:GNAT superfamily N-acetyltransferase